MGAMTAGSNPTDRDKLGTKRHVSTDSKGIPLSAIITSASIHDIKTVTEVINNAIVKRSPSSCYSDAKYDTYRRRQHLCPDKAYNSKPIEQEIQSNQNMYLIYHIKEKVAKL
jgi:IS5 family transposase